LDDGTRRERRLIAGQHKLGLRAQRDLVPLLYRGRIARGRTGDTKRIGMDRHPGRPGLFGRVQPARHRPDRTADAFVHGKQRLAAVRGEDGHYLGVRDRRSDDGDFPLHRACGRWLRRASHLVLRQRSLTIRRQGRGGLADRDGGPKSVRRLVFHHRARLRRSAAYCLLRQRQHNPPIRRARQRDVGHFDNRWQ